MTDLAQHEMDIRPIDLDALTDRRPLPGDTLTGLYGGDLRILEELVALSVNRYLSTNRPSFLNATIMKAVTPPNYSGNISDCTAIILRNGEEDYPQSVNVAYAVKLNPAVRNLRAAAMKAQYRPGKDPAIDVERQLIRLELEEDTQEALVRLSETPDDDISKLAITGILRAVDASQPFDAKFKPKNQPELEELEEQR